MEHLSKLFCSPARVKLLRWFLFNPEQVYDRDELVARARITPNAASKELAALARAGLIKRKTFYKAVARPGSAGSKKRKTLGYMFDPKFPYQRELTRFLVETLSVVDADVRKRFKDVGPVKKLVLTGFFTNNTDGALDMLIVGNGLDEQGVEQAVRHIEGECGREIRYTIFDLLEYEYRSRARDKLIRDVFKWPHHVVIEK